MQNKSQIGGVLTIIAGAIGVIYAGLIVFVTIFMGYMANSPEFSADTEYSGEVMTMVVWIYGIMAFFLLAVGVLGIIGGIFSIKRRSWGMALTGAICGNLVFPFIGIPAIILVSMARSEFSSPPPAPSVSTAAPMLHPGQSGDNPS